MKKQRIVKGLEICLTEHLQDFHLSSPYRVQRNTDADEDREEPRLFLLCIHSGPRVVLCGGGAAITALEVRL